jgi:hypothetical protein
MEQEVRSMGSQQSLAWALVTTMRSVARKSGSQWERLSHEWLLVPDDWLKIRFCPPQLMHGGVRISVALPPSAFPAVAVHWANPGRWPGWSTFWVRHEEELPALLDILDLAYYSANNLHRRIHGKPEPQMNLWSMFNSFD